MKSSIFLKALHQQICRVWSQEHTNRKEAGSPLDTMDTVWYPRRGGVAGPKPLTAPPPPSLEIGRGVLAIGAEDAGKKKFLPREGVDFFAPFVYTQSTQNLWRRQLWRKTMKTKFDPPPQIQ